MLVVRATGRWSPGERMAGDGEFAAFYEANYERLVVQLFAVTGNL